MKLICKFAIVCDDFLVRITNKSVQKPPQEVMGTDAQPSSSWDVTAENAGTPWGTRLLPQFGHTAPPFSRSAMWRI